ncbi:DUF5655 domain-containing protein [Streptomyces sp. NPDC057623]|uniref:DUF5655 domain-containing protein n=1 Tax=Streptomyces sp. NPDC057623 TaxID=3346187 RepID=UPI0036A073CD
MPSMRVRACDQAATASSARAWGCEAVAEIGVGEGVDALVLLRVPAHQGVAVLLLGTDVVGKVGQGTGGVAGDGAGGRAADAGVAGLGAVVAQEGVFGGEQGAGCCGHDRVAVKRLRERIDLVRYRIFDGGLLSLLLIESAPGSPSQAPARPQHREREITAGAIGGDGKPSFQAVPGASPACLRDLYAELDEALTAWGEVEVSPLMHYIAYRRMVNLASVIFRPKHEVILVYLRIDPDTVELEEGFSRDMRGIGHLGTGDLEMRIGSASDLEKARPLIRRAFEAA